MGRQVGSDSVGAALRAAANDGNTRAVVLHVDSPGGSAVASDTIWREVCQVRAAGKPVIVSMGDSTNGFSLSLRGGVPHFAVTVGVSDGAGLAAGLALLARDRGELAIAFQALIYPMIDDRQMRRAMLLHRLAAPALQRAWGGCGHIEYGLLRFLHPRRAAGERGM